MNCVCHGEPRLWRKDLRWPSGGYWRCAVKKRLHDEAHSEKKRTRQRDRYDADPVHRIEKNLHDHARRRAQTLARKREALRGEV